MRFHHYSSPWTFNDFLNPQTKGGLSLAMNFGKISETFPLNLNRCKYFLRLEGCSYLLDGIGGKPRVAVSASMEGQEKMNFFEVAENLFFFCEYVLQFFIFQAGDISTRFFTIVYLWNGRSKERSLEQSESPWITFGLKKQLCLEN